MNKIKLAVIISLSVVLSGCFETRKNTEQLCESNPALQCDQLNVDDGQCRVPRTDLIWHHHETLSNPSDDNKIKQYHLLAEYEKCMTLAAQIQTLTPSERKSKRVTAVLHAQEEKVRIVSELEASNAPQTLYFLWSQTGNEEARRQFLQMEGSKMLDTAEMQYALATFYTNRDTEKTLYLLNRSLELSDGKNTNIDAVKTLASLNLQEDKLELAYVWQQVAAMFDVQTTHESNHALLYGFTQDKYKRLDMVAEQVHEDLESGKFRASAITIPNM